MSIWSMAATAAMVGAVAAVPQQVPQPAQAPAPPVVAVESQQRVSVDFQHASVSDVLDWLTKNGVSFVAADSELPKDASITLNAKDVPMSDLLDSVASALGGHWEPQGSMLVFRKGEGFGAWNVRALGRDGNGMFMTPPRAWKEMPGGNRMFVIPNVKGLKDGTKIFITPDGKDLKELPEMKGLEMPPMPDVHVEIPDLKGLQDVPGWSDEDRQSLEDAMRAAQGADKESLEAAQKAMEQARKEIEKARLEHPEAFNGRMFVVPNGGEGYQFAAPNGKSFRYRMEPGKTFEFRGSRNMRTPGANWAPEVWAARKMDITKFMTSLSEEQKEKNRRQGYLRASDLTESQRKMLGLSERPKGFKMTIDKDGEKITIKSDD